MTHATYAFLIEILDPEGNDTDIIRQVTERLVDFEDRLDENNWYQAEAIVLRSGRVICLCENDEYFQGDDLTEDFSQVPEAQRWDYARLFALQCVANDFEFGWDPRLGVPLVDEAEISTDERNRFDTLLQRILSEMPARLAKLWGQGSLVNAGVYDDDFFTHIRRADWSTSMNKLLDSVCYGHPPFADKGTPYDYRAFLLCSDPKRANAILFVDIHT